MAPKKMPKKNSTSRNQSMAVPSRHGAWPDRSSRRRAPSGGEAGHDLEHVVAVAVELRRPHALDEAQRPQIVRTGDGDVLQGGRSAEHTSELQSLMRISYAVICRKKKK